MSETDGIMGTAPFRNKKRNYLYFVIFIVILLVISVVFIVLYVNETRKLDVQRRNAEFHSLFCLSPSCVESGYGKLYKYMTLDVHGWE